MKKKGTGQRIVIAVIAILLVATMVLSLVLPMAN